MQLNKNKKLRTCFLSIIIKLCLIVVCNYCCAVTENTKNINLDYINQQLNQAKLSTVKQSNLIKLDTAMKLIDQNEFLAAKNILKLVKVQHLNTLSLIDYKILQAKLYINKREHTKVLNTLNPLLERINRVNYIKHKLDILSLCSKANYHKSNYYLSLEQLLELHKLAVRSNSAEYELNVIEKDIWNTVNKLKSKDVIKYLKNNQVNNKNLNAWLNLAVINKTIFNYEKLKHKLKLHKQTFKNHPSNKLIADTEPTEINLNKIHFILPTVDDYSMPVEAITNGFLTAYYQDKSKHKPEIEILPSDAHNILYTYQKALSDNSDLIIGPLLKEDVESLLKVSSKKITTPILTLNEINNEHANNVYQFSLNPEDEARALANRAFKNNYKNILVIRDDKIDNTRVQEAFEDEWEKLSNNKIVSSVIINDEKDAEEKIKNVLKIQASLASAKLINKIIKAHVKHKPRIRNDIDLIILSLDPQLNKSIKPLLNFYYAGDIQVYTTSSSLLNNLDKDRVKDLNNIIFTDMPWFSTNRSDVLKKRNFIKKYWPLEAENLGKLHAMGADVYYLAQNINKLRIFPGSTYQGVTGVLYLDEDLHIKRHFTWTKVVDNTAIVLKK